MKKARFTESQIMAILKEADAGLPAGTLHSSTELARLVTTSGNPSEVGWMPRSSNGLRSERRSWRSLGRSWSIWPLGTKR